MGSRRPDEGAARDAACCDNEERKDIGGGLHYHPGVGPSGAAAADALVCDRGAPAPEAELEVGITSERV